MDTLYDEMEYSKLRELLNEELDALAIASAHLRWVRNQEFSMEPEQQLYAQQLSEADYTETYENVDAIVASIKLKTH